MCGFPKFDAKIVTVANHRSTIIRRAPPLVAPAGSSKKRANAAEAKAKREIRAVYSDDEEKEKEEEKPKVKRSKTGPSDSSPAVTRQRAKMLGIPLHVYLLHLFVTLEGLPKILTNFFLNNHRYIKLVIARFTF